MLREEHGVSWWPPLVVAQEARGDAAQEIPQRADARLPRSAGQVPGEALPVAAEDVLGAGRTRQRAGRGLHRRLDPEHVGLRVRKPGRQLDEQVDGPRL